MNNLSLFLNFHFLFVHRTKPAVVELKSLQGISRARFSYSNHRHWRETSKVENFSKKIVAQKLSLLRVAGVTVRQGGPNVVLDLDVTYTGEAYLGVSVMKVIYLNKKCDKPDDRTDRNGQI